MVKIASNKKTSAVSIESRVGAVEVAVEDFGLILSNALGNTDEEDSLGVFSLIKLLAAAGGDAQAQVNLIQTSKGKIRKLLIASPEGDSNAAGETNNKEAKVKAEAEAGVEQLLHMYLNPAFLSLRRHLEFVPELLSPGGLSGRSKS